MWRKKAQEKKSGSLCSSSDCAGIELRDPAWVIRLLNVRCSDWTRSELPDEWHLGAIFSHSALGIHLLLILGFSPPRALMSLRIIHAVTCNRSELTLEIKAHWLPWMGRSLRLLSALKVHSFAVSFLSYSLHAHNAKPMLWPKIF